MNIIYYIFYDIFKLFLFQAVIFLYQINTTASFKFNSIISLYRWLIKITTLITWCIICQKLSLIYFFSMDPSHSFIVCHSIMYWISINIEFMWHSFLFRSIYKFLFNSYKYYCCECNYFFQCCIGYPALNFI